MIVDDVGLKRHRARIERIEKRHVAHWRQRHADQGARTVGDLRVDEIEQHVEIVFGGVLAGELARQSASVDAAFDASAELVKNPACATVEVLVEQAGERGDGGQRLVDAVDDLRFGEWAPRASRMTVSSRPINCQVCCVRRSRITEAA